MAYFANDLQPSSLVVLEAKIHYISMMIAGPRQSGNNIGVCFTPLIEDLRKLWVDRVYVYDGNVQQTFRLCAIIFCTVNDFPAYRNLSGYNVKGHHTCPICEKKTSYIQLKHGKKTIYTRHRRFLKHYHSYQRLKKGFNGTHEIEGASKTLAGHEVYDQAKDIVRHKGRIRLRRTFGRKG